MSEAKVQKLLAINERLRQEEAMERVPISTASKSLVEYTKTHEDPLLKPTIDNPFAKKPPGAGCVVI